MIRGEWGFREFTASRLLEAEEGRIINEWLDHVRVVCAENGSSLENARLYHWSPAETSTLATAYNSAAARHGVPAWRELPWIDLLKKVPATYVPGRTPIPVGTGSNPVGLVCWTLIAGSVRSNRLVISMR